MLRVVIALGAVLGFTGCTGSSIRSQEGHACSTNSSDDPQLVCSPAQDLVCITTYAVPVSDPKVAAQFDGGIRQVYVCRLACNSTAECPQSGDICCPGAIFGKTYNKVGGCVPPSSCNDQPPDEADAGVTPTPDAAAKETGAADTTASDKPAADTSAADAGSPDTETTAMDAPAGS
jgi:hypothetical protein